MNEKERIKKWCQDNSYKDNNLFIDQLRQNELTDKQIIVVLNALENTCQYCFNRPIENDDGLVCRCSNDE